MSRESLLIYNSLSIVRGRSNPALKRDLFQGKLSGGELALGQVILEHDKFYVNQCSEHVPRVSLDRAGDPAHDGIERPPVQEGETDKKQTEGKVLCRIQNGAFKEGFGLGELGTRGERRG